jgi:hypothetical protein
MPETPGKIPLHLRRKGSSLSEGKKDFFCEQAGITVTLYNDEDGHIRCKYWLICDSNTRVICPFFLPSTGHNFHPLDDGGGWI